MSTQQALEPDEQVQAVIATQTFHPMFVLVGFLWIFVFGGRYRLVVATDRRIVVLKTKLTSYRRPVGVLGELPRDTRLGPVGGPPASIVLGGRRLYVIAGTKKFVDVADQLLPFAPTPG
jgi:hypothetical protein